MENQELTVQQQFLVDAGLATADEFLTETSESTDDNDNLEVTEETTTEVTPPTFTSMSEARAEFNAQRGVRQEIDPTIPIPTGEPIQSNPTANLTSVAERVDETDASTITFGNLYKDELPTDNSWIPFVEVPLTTQALSTLSDTWDWLKGESGDLSESQIEMKKFQEEANRFSTTGQQIYKSIGYNGGDGDRYKKIYGENENGEYAYLNTVIVPKPDSSFFGRVFSQSGRDIVQGMGDLMEGHLMSESDFSKNMPDMKLDTAESIFNGILTFGITSGGAFGATKKVFTEATKGLLKPKNVKRAGYIAGSIGAGASDTIFVPEEDQGLIITADRLQKALGIEDPLEAANLAMFTDALVTGLIFDGVLKVVGVVARKGKDIASSVARLGATKEAVSEGVQKLSQRDTVIDTLAFIDPTMKNSTAGEYQRKLKAFALMLKDNAELDMTIGKIQKNIPLDSSNAIMRGAKTYILDTQQNLIDELGEDGFNAYADKEGAAMVQRIIQLARSNDAKQLIASNQARIIGDLREGIQDAATEELPQGFDPQFAIQTGTQSLVTKRADDLTLQNTIISNAETALEKVKRDKENVVLDNEELQALLSERNSIETLFREKEYLEPIQKILGEDLYSKYAKELDDIDAAYKAIDPDGTELPEESIFALRDMITEVVKDANALDSSGGQTQRILGKIATSFQERITGVEPKTTKTQKVNLSEKDKERVETLKLKIKQLKTKKKKTENQKNDLAKAELSLKQIESRKTKEVVTEYDIIKETPEEFVERILKQGELTVSNLIGLKQNLANMIEETTDKAVRARLIDLKNSITSTKEGGQLAIISEVDEEIAERITEADDLFRGFQSQFGNDEVLKQFTKQAGTQRAVGETYTSLLSKGSDLKGGVDFEIGNVRTADLVINDRSGALIPQLEYALGNSDLTEAAREKAIAKLLSDVGDALSSGNTGDISVLQNAIKANQTQIENVAPEFIDTFENIISSVKTQTKNLDSLEATSTATREIAESNKKNLEENIIKKFVSEGTDDLLAVSNPQATLKSLLKGDDAVNSVKKIKEKINELPKDEQVIALKALKNTTLRNLEESLFGATPMSLKSPNVYEQETALGSFTRIIEEGTDSTLAVIREVFSDDPNVAKTVEESLKFLGESNIPRRLKANPTSSDTANNLKNDISTGILLVFGYMNPQATGARRILAPKMEELENLQKQARMDTVALILSKPEEFARMIEKMTPGMGTQAKNTLVEMFVKGSRTEFRTSEMNDNLEEATP